MIFSIGVISAIISCAPFTRQEPISYQEWKGTRDSLCKRIIREVGNSNLSFYCPVRRHGDKLLWTITDGDSIVFHVSEEMLEMENIRCCETQDAGLTQRSLKENLLKEARSLRKKHIYSIIRNDSLLRITTTYYDTSYYILKKNNVTYKEFTQEIAPEKSSGNQKFVFVVLLTTFNPSEEFIKNFSKSHFLWRIESNVFCYRTYIN